MGLLQRTAPLPGGRGQWNSCNARPHCLGAVGSGILLVHRPPAWGKWVAYLLQYTAALPGGSGHRNSSNALPHQRALGLVQRTAPLPGGSRPCNSCNTLPHCLGGSGQRISCNTLPHFLGAVGSGTSATHRLTTWAQWAVELLQRTAAPPRGYGSCNPSNTPPHCLGGTGQRNSCNAPSNCLEAVGPGTSAIHCCTAWGQWAVKLLQYTASLPGDSGR